MDGVIAAAGSDWSLTGSILTFAFPVFLFIAVAVALWVLYTMPHPVPGLRYQPERGPARPAPAAPASAPQPGPVPPVAGQAGPAGQATAQQPQPGPAAGRPAAASGPEVWEYPEEPEEWE